MSKIVRIAVVAAAMLSLAACGMFLPSAKERAARNTAGFKAGYTDGCAAANAQGTDYRRGPARDDDAYKADENYRAGWASGYANCRPAVARGNPAQPGVDSPVPDHNPGGPSY